jgi:hypothetical protein
MNFTLVEGFDLDLIPKTGDADESDCKMSHYSFNCVLLFF